MKVLNFPKPKSTDKHSLLIFAYVVSMSVRVLEANAIGHPSYISAVHSPYSLASVCICTGLVQSW